MSSIDKNLFKIGEVAKTLGVTRKIILNYEELGLAKPVYIEKESGFRYYSPDNIVHIRLIRTLQNLGLSLPEIGEYFDNTLLLGDKIDRLVLLRNQLDQYIAQLRLRQAKKNAHDIQSVTLPAFTAYCREFHDADIAKKTADLRVCYTEAVKYHRLDTERRMCIQVSVDSESNGRYLIPVLPECKGEFIVSFPQVAAICIYHRGSYEEFPKIHARLLEYAAANGMTPNGYFRNIYMEGPPTHGANKAAYITQVALPIKFIE